MFFLTRPRPAQVRAFGNIQQAAAFSYAEVGVSRDASAPPGYAIDRYRLRLGRGSVCFEAARNAVQRLELFQTGWIALQNPAAAPLREGQTLVLQIKHLGFYSLIANRIVYVVDEANAFGFGYGTLSGHAEQGEERFLVRHLSNDEVVFEIFAFSRPVHPLARLGSPVVRLLQQRAARAYGAAIAQGLSKLTE